MRENRLLRFTSIEGLSKHHLPFAAEIWLEELCDQPWASREIAKLATHFKRYLDKPEPSLMALARIENDCHIERQRVVESLRQMHSYGVLNGYAIDVNLVRASLHLSLLQRLRVLEASRRWLELTALSRQNEAALPTADHDGWLASAPAPDDDYAPPPFNPALLSNS